MTAFNEDKLTGKAAEAATSAKALEEGMDGPHVDMEQPPSYEEASATPTPLAQAVTRVSAQFITPVPAHHQSGDRQTPVPTREPKSDGCFSSYLASVLNARAWASCFYFMFVSITVGTFAFCWIVCTFVGAVVSMLFPPVGYFLCVGTAWSWRALGRFELLSVEFCIDPTRFLGCGSRPSLPPIAKTLPSVTVPAHAYSGWVSYGVRICFNRFTWMCFVYFVFIKFWTCLAAFVLVTTLFSLSFPFMLCIMPVTCIICRKLGEWEARLARAVLLA